MTERPRGLSKSSSMSSMTTSGKERGSLFSAWRSRASAKRPGAAATGASDQHVGLEGKQLRDAVWKQQRPREPGVPATAARPLRVIRYTPPRGTRHQTNSDRDVDENAGEDDDDLSVGDDLSNAGGNSARGAGPRVPHNYDDTAPPQSLGNSRLGRSRQRPAPDDLSASRMSLTLSRLSFSASARSSIAEYKAKKYDVEWKKDDDVADCQVCRLAFTKWSRRRHHCRVCGDIICDDCSPDLVLIDGLFTRPKRSCTACFELLEAMMHLGDAHVKMMVEKEPGTREWVDATPAKRRRSTDKPPAVYHDRLAEIQRVTAAGKKSRRSGAEGRMCVINARWLRSWLAFTTTDDPDGDDLGTTRRVAKKDRADSGGSVLASSLSRDGVPGVIDNLSLLVMKKGCLLPRDGLARSDTQNFTDSEMQGRGDFQTIPFEVWEVLSRYYGGGPRIDLVYTSDSGEFGDQWVVDAAAVVCFGRALKANPQAPPGASAAALTVEEKVIERALMERHDPLGVLDDGFSSSSSRGIAYDATSDAPPPQAYASSSCSSFSSSAARPPAMARSVSDTLAYSTPSSSRPGGVARNPTPSMSARSQPEPPNGHQQRAARRPPSNPERTPTTTTAKAAPASLNQHSQHQNSSHREPDLEPKPAVCTARSSRNGSGNWRGAGAGPPPPHGARSRNQSQSQGEPTAASAASAFALAMKEARLKQQRAISGGGGGSSRAAATAYE